MLIYNLSNESSEKELLRQLKTKFTKHKTASENDIKYFNFAERKLPGVQDAIQEIMDGLTLNDSDYIALFYTREEEPDVINRLMVFGTSNLIDNDLKNISQTNQDRILGELLEYDFLKKAEQ